MCICNYPLPTATKRSSRRRQNLGQRPVRSLSNDELALIFDNDPLTDQELALNFTQEPISNEDLARLA
jgi:hypothetical protein